MKLHRTLPLLLAAALMAGCSKSDDMSATDQQKMRDAMSSGRKEGAMTPDQKAGFEKWKAGGGMANANGGPDKP